MKQVIHKTTLIAMALIVLCSTMSFSVDMHFCGDHLVDFSIIGNVDTCMMQMEKSEPVDRCPSMNMTMDCCNDVELTHIGQDDLKISFDRIALDQQVFLSTLLYFDIHLFEGYDQDVILFKDYSPPRLIRDTLILDQTFLI